MNKKFPYLSNSYKTEQNGLVKHIKITDVPKIDNEPIINIIKTTSSLVNIHLNYKNMTIVYRTEGSVKVDNTIASMF